MTNTAKDNSDVIDRIHAVIRDSKQAGINHAKNATRQHGEYQFVIGYIQALLVEGLVSRDVAYSLIAELDEAWKDVLAATPGSSSTPRKKLKP